MKKRDINRKSEKVEMQDLCLMSVLLQTQEKHKVSTKKPHPNTLNTKGLPGEPVSKMDGETERHQGRGKQNNHNLTGNVLLQFVSSDFEIRLKETQLNEEK